MDLTLLHAGWNLLVVVHNLVHRGEHSISTILLCHLLVLLPKIKLCMHARGRNATGSTSLFENLLWHNELRGLVHALVWHSGHAWWWATSWWTTSHAGGHAHARWWTHPRYSHSWWWSSHAWGHVHTLRHPLWHLLLHTSHLLHALWHVLIGLHYSIWHLLHSIWVASQLHGWSDRGRNDS